MGYFSRKRKAKNELQKLAEEKQELESQIDNIKEFIETAPEKLAQEEHNKRATLPAPDELEDRMREKNFHARLSRGDVSNQHRYQAKNGIFFILLILMAAGLFSWAWRIFAG